MKSVFRYNLKGNTIIEVLIAMAILTFVSALSVIIYLNIQKSSTPFFRIKSIELAEQYLSQTISNKDYTEGSIQIDEFELKRQVSRVENFPDCQLLRIIVFSSSKKKIHEVEQVIFNEYK